MENLKDVVDELKFDIVDVLKDTLQDRKKEGKWKNIIILVLMIMLFASFILYQWDSTQSNMNYQNNIKQLAEENDQRFKDFLSQYDFETTTVEQNDNQQGTNSSTITE